MLIILKTGRGCLIEFGLLKFKCDVVCCGIKVYKSQLEKGIKKICLMKPDLWSDKFFANGRVQLSFSQVEPVKSPLTEV